MCIFSKFRIKNLGLDLDSAKDLYLDSVNTDPKLWFYPYNTVLDTAFFSGWIRVPKAKKNDTGQNAEKMRAHAKSSYNLDPRLVLMCAIITA